jgi:hypothetical protein
MKLPRREFLYLAAGAAALPAVAILLGAASVAVWTTVAQAQTASEKIQSVRSLRKGHGRGLCEGMGYRLLQYGHRSDNCSVPKLL